MGLVSGGLLNKLMKRRIEINKKINRRAILLAKKRILERKIGKGECDYLALDPLFGIMKHATIFKCKISKTF